MAEIIKSSLVLTNGGALTGWTAVGGSWSVASGSLNGTGQLDNNYSAAESLEPFIRFRILAGTQAPRRTIYFRQRIIPATDSKIILYLSLVGTFRATLYDRITGGSSPVGINSSPAPDQAISGAKDYDFVIGVRGTGASTVMFMRIRNATDGTNLTWSGATEVTIASPSSITTAGFTSLVADSGGYANYNGVALDYGEEGATVLPTDASTTIARTMGTTNATLAITSTATNTPLVYSWNVAGSSMPAGAKSAATGAATSTLVVPSGLVAGSVYTIALTITDANSNTLTRTISFTTRRVALPATLPKFGVVGNSITVGGSPNWLEGAAAIVSRVLKTPSSIASYRYSLSGSSSAAIAAGASTTAADFAANGVTDVFVGPIATNDTGAAADTFANTTTLVNAMIAAIPTVRIWLMPDVAKTGGPLWYQGGSSSEVARMRAYLSLCAGADNGNQIRYVGDLIYDLSAIAGIPSDDGTHPTNQGYVDMGQIVAAEWMRRMGYALPASSGGGGGGGGTGDELMTISNPTRQVPLSSSAYELFAQDGDVIEGSADGDVYIRYVTAGSGEPDAELAGPIMLTHESFERGHTLDGVDGYARATGRNCNLWVNGTMAALP